MPGVLEPSVATAWLIIESVSEDLALKKQVFGELDRLAEPDAILATNSSSYPSSRLLDVVGSPERLLNVHFQMPPELIAVELMSCGRTDVAVIDALAGRLPRYGLVPFTVRRGQPRRWRDRPRAGRRWPARSRSHLGRS